MSHSRLSRTMALWRFGGLTPWQVLVRSVLGYRQARLDACCAQFAYYSMLGLAPLLIVVLAVISRLPLKGVLDSFLEGTGRTLPQGAYDVIVTQIEDVGAHSTTGLVLASLVLLAFAGSRLFLTLSRGLNASYGVTEKRRGWQTHVIALSLTTLTLLMLLAALVLLVVGPMITQWLTSRVELPFVQLLLYRGVRWAVVCAAVMIATAAIYSLAPNADFPFAPLAPGSVFATAGWVTISLGFRAFVNNFGRYNETYGTLAGVIILIVWLYLNGTVLLIGGQINAVTYRAAAEPG